MKIRTTLKAGTISSNHSASVVQAKKPQAVKTGVRAGIVVGTTPKAPRDLPMNHNQTVARPAKTKAIKTGLRAGIVFGRGRE
jgi:hypothetical protein